MVNKTRELLINETDNQIRKLEKQKEKMEIETLVDTMIEKAKQGKNEDPKEIIEKALKGLNEINNETNVTNPTPEEIITNKLEIMDHATADIQHLFNQLINNTGIIEFIALRFKIGLTPTVLQVLSTHKELLSNNWIQWDINKYEDEIELILEKDK